MCQVSALRLAGLWGERARAGCGDRGHVPGAIEWGNMGIRARGVVIGEEG